MIYKELSYQVIGCCMDVHSVLGPGLLENCYHNALFYALKDKNLNVVYNKSFKAIYHENVVGEYFADLVVENKIIIELKSVKQLSEVHMAQLLNYLHLSGYKLGFLVIFQGEKLEWKRMTVE